MPAPPEFLYTAGHVGASEVFHQVDTQQPGTAHRNVGIAGEIAVDLHAEQDCGQNQGQTALACQIIVDGVDILRHKIRNDHFFEQAHTDFPQSGAEARPVRVVLLMQLGQQIARPFDGPGHQLGEKAHIQRIVAEVVFGFQVAAVDIHHITQGLEGVKADAHRQNQFQGGGLQRQSHRLQQRRHILREEVEIFEEKQATQA